MWSFAYNGKGMNISFQKVKKKCPFKWAMLGGLLCPLTSGFNSDAGDPGQALQRTGAEAAVAPRPYRAAGVPCDSELLALPVWFPLPWPPEPCHPRAAIVRMNVWHVLVLE